MERALKYNIHTFGCQMNVHDSEKMAGLLSEMGYLRVEKDSDADLILFNTCTVRDHAHHKAISEIGRAVHMKKKRPDLIVGVCGCVAQEEKARLFEIYPKLNLVFGPDQIGRLPELLSEVGSMKYEVRKTATELIDDPADYSWLSETKSPLTPLFQRGEFNDVPPFIKGGAGGISRFLTIMKGCNNNCSFCIVPFVRGHEISKPADMIIDEINTFVKQGVKEVTLLGQNVNSYAGAMVRWCDSAIAGKRNYRTIEPSNHRTDFVQLLQKISAETNILRIRYTSPHPKDLTSDLIEEHAINPKLCRHMHLPLQAGSDNILRAMKRSYNKKQFIEKVSKLRSLVPGIDITTDIIVGFPGETEKDFQDTLEVVKEASFDGMFAFKYSPRSGTKAAELENDVPQKEKEERLARLLELNAKIWKGKTGRLIGTMQEVLVEGVSKREVRKFECHPESAVADEGSPESTLHGRSFASLRMTNRLTPICQLTGRSIASKIVNFSGNLELVGHIVPVKIIGAGANSLKGKLICSSK